MVILEKIQTALEENLTLTHLDIIDESHLHEGHGGYRQGEVTHIRLRLNAEEFEGLSRLEQHRKINAILAPFMNNPIHALAIEVK